MEVNKIYETKILRQNNELAGVGIIDDMVVFFDGALTGELVKVKIDKIYKNYATGSIIEIIEKSKDRRVPICPFYYECGGCNLMHIDHELQLELKKEKIISIFKKICNIDISLDKVNSYNNLYYRNKVVFKVKEDKIGFYKPKSNDLVDINECIISDKKINDCLLKIRNFIKENINHKISEVMIRVCDDEVMIKLDNLNADIKNKFINLFIDVSSIYVGENLEYGVASLNQKLSGLVFDVSPKSFFQVNKIVAEKLYSKALSYVSKSDTTIDLYSGTGTITMLLAGKSRKVIGIEVVKEAVVDARNNLLLNNIDNVEFICDKVENKIETLKDLKVDALIMDPPRGGSDKKSLRSILEIGPKKIIYISCNPVTLARDINTLKEKYELKEISAFDMFSNTYHVETIAFLIKKDSNF